MAVAAPARMMATILPFPGTAVARMPPPPAQSSPPAADHGAAGDNRWDAWMLLAQAGDRAAYQTLLQAVAPYVRGIARRYLGHGEDAEDAVQDILLIVHGIRHTYERGRPFKPWLATIASRRCIDLLRRRARRLRHEVESDPEFDPAGPNRQAPEDAVARLDAAHALHAAVAALPERQREAIRLLRLKELSLNEASALTDQSTGALKVACHRAIKSLRRSLRGKDVDHD